MYRWKRWEHWALWVAVLLLLGAAVGLAVWGFDERDKSERLDDVGVEVPAELLSVDVDSSGDSTTSTLRVRFVQRGDARTVTTAEIDYDGDFEEDEPAAVRAGDVRVEYDPDDPELVRLAGDDRDRGTELLIGAAVLVVFGVALAAFAAYAWRYRDRI